MATTTTNKTIKSIPVEEVVTPVVETVTKKEYDEVVSQLEESKAKYEEAVKINKELNDREARLYKLLSTVVDSYVSNK